jgi:two-component system OmpR family sensor kinase
MSMSIRLRLTLLYSAILALTLALFGAALYEVVDRATFAAAKDRLVADTSAFATAFHTYGNPSAQSQPLGLLNTADTFVQIRFDDGLVGKSDNLQASKQTLPLDPSTVAALQSSTSPGPEIVTVGGQQFLLANTLLIARGHVNVLQVARPLRSIDQQLDVVRNVLLVGGPIATLLAFGAGWLLAGTALRPIARITRTAQAIGEAQDFDRRVIYQGPRDEVGRLATTFNIMLARLAEAYETQQRFVADASHELRTPLTSIRGNLALLRREPPIAATDRVAILADLDGESERMARLVGDLLTLARADDGRELRREPVRVAPVRAATLRRVQALHPMHAPRDEGGPDVAVLGDRDALTQVLLVLLDNACKFTPPDGTVAVTTAIEGDRVAIAVRDTGQGIPLDALPHVFDRFYQGDISRTGTGAGLGLAIARALVEGQGGAIAVESRAGAGSTFTVTLPRAPMDEPAPALVGAAATSSPGS